MSIRLIDTYIEVIFSVEPLVGLRLHKNVRPGNPMVEVEDLKSFQCRFESDPGHALTLLILRGLTALGREPTVAYPQVKHPSSSRPSSNISKLDYGFY